MIGLPFESSSAAERSLGSQGEGPQCEALNSQLLQSAEVMEQAPGTVFSKTARSACVPAQSLDGVAVHFPGTSLSGHSASAPSTGLASDYLTV